MVENNLVEIIGTIMKVLSTNDVKGNSLTSVGFSAPTSITSCRSFQPIGHSIFQFLTKIFFQNPNFISDIIN